MPHSQFNMLKARSAASGPPPRSYAWLRVTFLVLVITAVTLTLASLPFMKAVHSLYRHAEDGRAELVAAQRSAETLNIAAALDHVDAAEHEFAGAQRDLVTLSPFAPLPIVGPYVTAADDALQSGVIAVSAVRDVLLAVEDIIAVLQEGESLSEGVTSIVPDRSTLFHNVTPAQKRALLAALERNAGRFGEATTKIDAALAAFDRIDGTALSPDMRETLAGVREKLVMLRGVFGALGPIAEYVPPLVGYPEEKRYLLFFQNNTELRPTGGFLGLYGEIRVKDGELLSVDSDDIYALDGPAEATERPDPPPPIAKYIGVEQWYLRDANWSPDFPTAAETMERFYREEAAIATPEQADLPIDGIIAVTPQLASDLLRLTGPITVEGKTFDANNLVDELEFQVEQNFVREGIALEERKDIVGDLMDALVDRLSSMPIEQLLAALGVVHRNLDESHVLLAMKDERLQRLVLENDWGGKLHSPPVDYVTVIDANLASLKSDPAVHRTVSYRIEPAVEGYVASVAMTYDHRGTFDWKTTRYRTYTRLYAPPGSRLLEVRGAMENDRLKDPARRPGTPDVGEEFGKTWFGAFISVEPKEQRTLEFRYVLPESVTRAIEDGDYRLYVEKQPGTTAHGLTLDLEFGKNLRSATPPEEFTEFGDQRYRYRTDLRIDREFSVGLHD